jgi:hypothetical protein
MIPESILEAAKYAIVIISLAMFVVFLLLSIRWKGKGYAWIGYGLSLFGMYWAVYYILSLSGFVIGSTHQFFVRSPIFLTLAWTTFLGIKLLRRAK